MALRQVWLQETGRRLQLIYEGGSLTDCLDEKLEDDDDGESCSSSVYSDDYDDDTSIEVFDVDDENPSRIPHGLSWLSSTSELRHRCSHVRTKARNQLIAQHRRRYLLSTSIFSIRKRGKFPPPKETEVSSPQEVCEAVEWNNQQPQAKKGQESFAKRSADDPRDTMVRTWSSCHQIYESRRFWQSRCLLS